MVNARQYARVTFNVIRLTYEATNRRLILIFVSGEWWKLTTKDAKSAKVRFDELFQMHFQARRARRVLRGCKSISRLDCTVGLCRDRLFCRATKNSPRPLAKTATLDLYVVSVSLIPGSKNAIGEIKRVSTQKHISQPLYPSAYLICIVVR